MLHSLALAFGVASATASPAPAEPSPVPVGTAAATPATPAPSATPTTPATLATPSTPSSPGAIASPSVPPLQLAKTRLELNRNSTSSIAISGGIPPYAVAVSQPIADVRIDAGTQTLSVRGVANGSATVTVSDATGATVVASLLVAPDAGFVPATLDVALIGAPSHDFVVAQIRAALERAAHPLPGARLSVGDYGGAGMRPGERLDAALPVHLDGANRYVDVDGVANVHVVTSAAEPIVPERLLYSDDPERIATDGVLLRATIVARHPVRLYYYHQAITPDRAFGVLLDSPGGTARVQILGEGAGPNAAVMYVGQSATYRYLDDRARGAGVVLDVPVGGVVDVVTGEHALHAGDLVAGALDLAVTSGDPVRVTVVSRTQGSTTSPALDAAELPSDGKHRRGEYDLTGTQPLALSYRLGDPDATTTVTVGSAVGALPNLRAGGHVLAGDYGVLRPVSLALSNPTSAAAAVTLYERATGYPVTTTLSLHGDPAPLRVQCVKNATKRYRVRSFYVPAQSEELVTGTYMTDGASTYPLTFGLTAGDADAPPAAMTGADGCFPPKAIGKAASSLAGRTFAQ